MQETRELQYAAARDVWIANFILQRPSAGSRVLTYCGTRGDVTAFEIVEGELRIATASNSARESEWLGRARIRPYGVCDGRAWWTLCLAKARHRQEHGLVARDEREDLDEAQLLVEVRALWAE